MNFYESICYSKFFAVASGLAPRTSITKQEFDIAVECLKKMIDNNFNLTKEQKEYQKLLIDFSKEQIKW